MTRFLSALYLTATLLPCLLVAAAATVIVWLAG